MTSHDEQTCDSNRIPIADNGQWEKGGVPDAMFWLVDHSIKESPKPSASRVGQKKKNQSVQSSHSYPFHRMLSVQRNSQILFRYALLRGPQAYPRHGITKMLALDSCEERERKGGGGGRVHETRRRGKVRRGLPVWRKDDGGGACASPRRHFNNEVNHHPAHPRGTLPRAQWTPEDVVVPPPFPSASPAGDMNTL